jgi:hypothetical protein
MNAEASTSRSRKASLSRRSRSGSSAKGKERADDVAEQLAPTGLIFNVRFTDGATEDVLALWVGEREAVRDVKRRVRPPVRIYLEHAGTVTHRSASSGPRRSPAGVSG